MALIAVFAAMGVSLLPSVFAQAAPAITTQPQSQSVIAGSDLSFNVVATGQLPLTYRWYRGTALVVPDERTWGEGTRTLHILGVISADTGDYWVTVSNRHGIATSSVATLTVFLPPTIVRHPTNQIAIAGSNVLFSVSATGSGPLAYQWRHNGSAITGATQTDLALNSVTATQAGSYDAVVTSPYGSVTSAVATLSVVSLPVITAQPSNQTVYLGAPASFSVTTKGDAPISYQWFRNGVPVASGKTSTLSFPAAQGFQAGEYFVTVSNLVGWTSSSTATLAVITQPVSLLNIDFGYAEVSSKTGAAAIGQTSSDFWNPDRWPFNGLVPSLKLADGRETKVSVGIVGTPHAWLSNGSEDPMYAGCDMAAAYGTITLTLNDLPPGTYDFYLYSDNTVFQLNVGPQDYGTQKTVDQPSGLPVWEQGRQYVAFRQVVVGNSNYPPVFVLSADFSGPARISGMQIAQFDNTNVPPAVWLPPRSQNVIAGSEAWLAATVTGSAPLSYQWQKDGVDLIEGGNRNGVKTAALAVWNMLPPDAGDYRLVVSNSAGFATSAVATVTVQVIPPAFTTQPQSQVTRAGSNVVLSAYATGTGPMAYQWFFHGTNLVDTTRITGSSSNNLSVTEAQPEDSGEYYVVATSPYAQGTSAVATLYVGIPPALEQSPSNQIVIAGNAAVFSVLASGTPPLSYSWRFNGNPLFDNVRVSGATNARLTIASVITSDAGNYEVVVTNGAGSVTSAVATLTVLVPPLISTQPRGYSVPLGMPVTLGGAATGSAPLAYQWLLNGVPVPAATNQTLVISNLVASQFGDYQLWVTNAGGAITSAVAALTVGPVAIWGTYSFAANLPIWPGPGLSNVIAVAGGSGYSLALRADGSLYGWGLGVVPTNVPSGSDFVAIAAGPSFALALGADGTVVAWGDGRSGQTNVPPGLSNVVAIAAGTSHSVALRADGSVFAWGSNSLGQTNIPAGFTDMRAVSAGGSQTLALSARGTVTTWGRVSDQSTPGLPAPPGLDDVVAVASGSLHHLALRSDGTVVTWGSPVYPAVTAMPTNLSGVVAVAASRAGADIRSGQSLALRTNGLVTAWGTMSFVGTNVPPGVSNVIAVALGDSHALALVNDGFPVLLRPPVGGTFHRGREVRLSAKAAGQAPLVFQWLKDGSAIFGATNETLLLPAISETEAGNYLFVVTNALGRAQSLPVAIAVTDSPPLLMSQPPTRFAYFGSPLSIGASVIGSEPMRLQWVRDGTLLSEGTNEMAYERAFPEHQGTYQLLASNVFGAITSNPARITFTRVAHWGSGLSLTNIATNLHDAIGVAAGGFSHSLLLRSNGTVFAWGTSLYGATNVPADLSNVVALAAGNYFSVALRGDGSAVAWGLGSAGQTNIPADATNLIAVSAGSSHALGLRADGSVVAWGSNAFGQTNVPSGLTNVVRISAGNAHSLALRSDGALVAWGSTFTTPTNLTGVVAIAAGYGQTLVLRNGGTVNVWDASLKPATVPAGLTNIVAVSSAGASSANYGAQNLVLRADGTPIVWGSLNTAQLNPPSEVVSHVVPACGAGFSLTLLGDRSPAFTVQPWNRQLAAGSNATLTAFAIGHQPISYQWRLQGTNLLGSTNASLALTSVLPAHAGDYTLVASNRYGVNTSQVAKVTVQVPQPALQWLTPTGTSFQFTFLSVPGIVYLVEYKTDLATPSWIELDRRIGNGDTITITDSNPSVAPRFYRVRTD